MKIKVIGFTKVDYKSKNDGHQVKGVNVFGLEEITSNGEGFKYVGTFNAGSFKPLFFSDTLISSDSFKLGTYEIGLDLNARINSVSFVSDK